MQLSVSTQTLENSAFPAPLQLVTLTNSHGLEVQLSSFGASIWAVNLHGKEAAPIALSVGYQNIEDWATNPYYFGITAGRVANRIGKAEFPLTGNTIKLLANERNNQLHGGPKGLSHCNWDVETIQDDNGVAAIFSITSPDGDQGFPGNLAIELEYRLTEANELILTYNATSDKTTPVCLTNHAYWNLASSKDDGIVGHDLHIHASNILALDGEQIPTGELTKVDNGPFDFKQTKSIGRDIKALDNGYDHFFVMDRDATGPSLQTIAVLTDPVSGRAMEISTTELGVQFYSGNFLDGSHQDAQGNQVNKYHGLCLETHGYPNAVNVSHFPSVMLEPNAKYTQVTVHSFKNL
ncbi:galactose mutarotase [Shewanella sp. A25]|nr:galactose mutarotase [Shewanella shenzhenensis]